MKMGNGGIISLFKLSLFSGEKYKEGRHISVCGPYMCERQRIRRLSEKTGKDIYEIRHDIRRSRSEWK